MSDGTKIRNSAPTEKKSVERPSQGQNRPLVNVPAGWNTAYGEAIGSGEQAHES